MINRLKYHPIKVHFTLLGILAFLIPSGFYQYEGLFIGLLFSNWIFGLKGYKKLKAINTEGKLLIAYFFVILTGLTYASELSSQWQYLLRNVSFLLIPLSFVGFELNLKQITLIKTIFLYSTIVFVTLAIAYALGSYLYTGERTIFLKKAHYSKFLHYGLTRIYEDWHPTYISMFANLSIVFSYDVFYKKKSYVKWVLTTGICLLAILLLNSFIGIISLGTILFIFAIQMMKSKTKRILVVLTTFIAISAFYIINPLNYDKIDKLKTLELKATDVKAERNIINLRLVKWKASYEVFTKSPVLGVSASDLRNELTDYYAKNNQLYAKAQRYTSHNQYMYILASSGIIGLIIFLSILLYPLKSNRETVFFIIIFALFCLSEDVLHRQQGQIYFVFMYAFFSKRITK